MGMIDPSGLCNCNVNAIEALQQAIRSAVMQYNQMLGDFQLANAEQNYANKNEATIKFIASSGAGLVTGAGIGAAGEAVNQALEEGTTTAQSLANQTAQDYLNGLASEQDMASTEQFSANMIGNLQMAKNVATVAQGGAAFAAAGLTNWLMGNTAFQGEDAVQGLLGMLPNNAAILPTILDQAEAGLLMQAQLSGNNMMPGSGQAFGFLARSLQAARSNSIKISLIAIAANNEDSLSYVRCFIGG